MVSSPMYDRLMQFADSAPDNEKLYGWDDEHSTVVKAIRKAQEKVEHFKDHQGFTGQAGEAMSAEAVRAFSRFNGQANYYLTGMSYYVEARRAIMLAAEEARQLSPTLLDPMTEAMRDAATVTIPVASNFGLPGQLVNSLAVTGAAYVNAVEAQANAQREAKSTEIIEHLESTMNNLSTRLKDHTSEGPDTSNPENREGRTPIPEIPKDSADALKKGHITISPYEGGAYGRSRSDAFGNVDLRGSESGLYPGGYNDGEGMNQRVMQSPRLPSRYFPEGEAGSRTNPISDPQDLMDMDLLHTRVNGDRHANGVIGGHTPAPPIDRDHPLWGLNASRAAESQTAGRLGGIGAMGAGALGLRGAARMGSTGMGALGRMGGGGTGSLGTAGAGALGRGGATAGASLCAQGRIVERAWAPTHHLVPANQLVLQARAPPPVSGADSWVPPALVPAARRKTRSSIAASTRPSASRMRMKTRCHWDTSIRCPRRMVQTKTLRLYAAVTTDGTPTNGDITQCSANPGDQ